MVYAVGLARSLRCLAARSRITPPVRSATPTIDRMIPPVSSERSGSLGDEEGKWNGDKRGIGFV